MEPQRGVSGFRRWRGQIQTPTSSPRCGTTVGALGVPPSLVTSGPQCPRPRGRWSGEPWPFPCRLKPNPLCFAPPQPRTPNPVGKRASLPEKLQWCLWALEMGCEGGEVLEHPLPGSSTGPGGTRRDVVMDQEGPGGMSLWGQEERGCRTRRDVVTQGQEGSGEVRRDQKRSGGTIVGKPGGPGGHHCSGTGETLLCGTRRDITGEPGGMSPQGQEGCGCKVRRDDVAWSRRDQDGPSLEGWKDHEDIIAQDQKGLCWRTRRDITAGTEGTRRTWRDL